MRNLLPDAIEKRQGQSPLLHERLSLRRNTRPGHANRIARPFPRQVQFAKQRKSDLFPREVPAHHALTVGYLPQGAAVLPGHAHRVDPFLGQRGVVQHQNPGIRGKRFHHHVDQTVHHGDRVPGALVDELLQRLPVPAGKAGGHRLDRLALPVQKKSRQIHRAPVPPLRPAQQGTKLLHELKKLLPNFHQPGHLHGIPSFPRESYHT